MASDLLQRIKRFAKKTTLTGALLLGSMLPAYASDVPKGFDITQQEQHQRDIDSKIAETSVHSMLSSAYNLDSIILSKKIIGVGLNSSIDENKAGQFQLRGAYHLKFDNTAPDPPGKIGIDIRLNFDYCDFDAGYYETKGDQRIGLLMANSIRGAEIACGGGWLYEEDHFHDMNSEFIDYEKSKLEGFVFFGILHGRHAGFVCPSFTHSFKIEVLVYGGKRNAKVNLPSGALDAEHGRTCGCLSIHWDNLYNFYSLNIKPGITAKYNTSQEVFHFPEHLNRNKRTDVVAIEPMIALCKKDREFIRISNKIEYSKHIFEGHDAIQRDSGEDLIIGFGISSGNIFNTNPGVRLSYTVERSVSRSDNWNHQIALECVLGLP